MALMAVDGCSTSKKSTMFWVSNNLIDLTTKQISSSFAYCRISTHFMMNPFLFHPIVLLNLLSPTTIKVIKNKAKLSVLVEPKWFFLSLPKKVIN